MKPKFLLKSLQQLYMNRKSVSLVELLVCIMSVSIMILSFYSLETFSHNQVMSADRRSKVQNSLAYCMEYMGKFIQQATGDSSNPGFALYSGADGDGFQIRVDFHVPKTPADYSDDGWVHYSVGGPTGNTLLTGCTGYCGAVSTGNLYSSDSLTGDKRILAGFVNGELPDAAAPGSGLYAKYTGSLGGNFVNYIDLGLVGQYDTSKTFEWYIGSRQVNPRVAMKTRLYCGSSF